MWLLLTLITLFFSRPVFAQEASVSATHPSEDLYQKYKTDYLFLRDAYQKSYLTYIDKSRVYTKYGTVTTQQEKTDAAKTAIIARNKMFKAYLMAIRVRLDVYQNSNSTETEKIKIELSKWESWFEEQNQVVNSINNEKDLDEWANNFKSKYIEIQVSIYSALIQGEVNTKTEALNQIQSLAAEIKNLPNYQSTDQNWINNLAIKTDLVKQGLTDSISLTKTQQNSNRFNDFYPDAQENFAKANNYLIEVVSDLKSVITKFIKK